jgi:signal transduction histidine kinase
MGIEMVQGLRQESTTSRPAAPIRLSADIRIVDGARTRAGASSRSLRQRGGRGVTTPQERARAEDVDLLCLLAHQIMTPLTLIDASAQRMARRSGAMNADEIKLRAGRIRAATARLSVLVRSIIERAKLEAGAAMYQQCKLRTLVGQACDPALIFQPARLFKFDLGPNIRFLGDPLLLEQLLAILVCNAAKYSPVDSPIEITGAIIDGAVRITVTDHGIGIPKADLPRLFEPYFRAANAAGYHGAGLGLNLAARIARLHSGSISVDTRLKSGTTFTVLLPVR